MSFAKKMTVYMAEYLRDLDRAERIGMRQARNLMIDYHNQKADQESNSDKKQWHKEEAARLADDSHWNT